MAGMRRWGYYFNPRPPRGGRLKIDREVPVVVPFQSSPPARGATRIQREKFSPEVISILAPREGGDVIVEADKSKGIGFQSSPPARGATLAPIYSESTSRFQSSPPARGATRKLVCKFDIVVISILAPREGGDMYWMPCPWRTGYFNPRPPRGGRRRKDGRGGSLNGFQSSPPARGATKLQRHMCGGEKISILAPREGGDPRSPE